MLQDLKFALRTFRKNPSFTAVATLTLALGIGANAAIFSVVDAIVLHPLPLPHPEQVVVVSNRIPGDMADWFSWLDFADVRDQSRSFQAVAAYRGDQYVLTGLGEPEQLSGTTATADLFSVLGVQPALGRAFAAGEDEPGRNHVVVLTDRLWRKRFSKDRNVLGRAITLNGEPYTIIGVTPPGLRFPPGEESAGVFAPMPHGGGDQLSTKRGIRALRVLARMKPGASVAQAQAELDTIQARLASAYPEANAGRIMSVVELQQQLVGRLGPAMLMLLIAVGFVLLIGCANVANLMLARATARQREIAVRAALGASRGRIVRQLLTESVLLGIIGGTLGLVFALWTRDGFVALLPDDVPRMAEIAIDARVLVFTAVVSVATGLLFGLVPALHATRVDLHQTLKGAESTSSGGRGRARAVLMAAEIALAMLLCVGAGLTLQSFYRLSRVDPGFNPHDVLTATMMLPKTRYPDAANVVAFYRELEDELRALPGAQATALSTILPLSGGALMNGLIIPGRPAPPEGDWPRANTRFVSPDYFRVMGIRTIRGRTFTAADDTPNAAPTVILNESAARKWWPHEDPIGQQIIVTTTNADTQPSYEIIGIVADVKFASLAEPTDVELYTPLAVTPLPNPLGGFGLFAAVRGPHVSSLSGPLRAAVQAVDKYQSIIGFKTMDEYLSSSLSQQRWSTVLLAIFGGLALLLAIVGVYGVVSYGVAQRTRELGIRIALGARASQVQRMILVQSLRLTLVGLAIGTGAALALTRFLESQLDSGLPRATPVNVERGLYGISTTDPTTFIGIAVLLMLVAMLASFLPARRATHVDPMVALRGD
jgi:putative ABC transport system permease protein